MNCFIGVFLNLLLFVTSHGYGYNETNFKIVNSSTNIQVPYQMAQFKNKTNLVKIAGDGTENTTRVPYQAWRIAGGNTIDITQVPYQVAVNILHTNDYCGGSILSNTAILTACHCFKDVTNVNQIVIKAGTNYRTNYNAPSYRVRRVILHPQFNLFHLIYDVAIVLLADPLVYSNTIRPIRLPQPNDYIPEGTTGIVSGWGWTRYPGPHPSYALKAAYLTTVNQRICEQVIEREYPNRNYIRGSFFCLAGQNFQNSACYGDSGGPWVVNGVLEGAVSWGFHCGNRRLPVIFSKVSFFLDFIYRASKL